MSQTAEPITPAARLLLLSPTVRDGQLSQRLFASAGIACDVFDSIFSLCVAFDEQAGAIIVPEEALVADEERNLTRSLGKQPVWSDVPVIVLARPGVEMPALIEALGTLTNASVIERPARVSTLLSQVRAALKARQRQYQVRDHLATLKEVEQKLREERRLLDSAVNAAALGTWATDAAGVKVVYSPRLRELSGLTPDQSIENGQAWNALHPDDRAHVAKCFYTARDQRTIYNTEYRAVHPDGSIRWLYSFGSGTYDEAGNCLGMSGATLDITERKTHEEERRELLEREQQASRAKDQFLAVLSHELRTPLSPVVMTLAALQEHPALPPELAPDIKMIRRNIDLETKLIDDLLDLSRVATGKLALVPQPMSIHDVLRHVTGNFVNDAAGKRVTLKSELHAARDCVSADPARVQQVFWNLIRNAVKFTPPGGTVTVTSRNTDVNGLEIEIRDTGIGIPPEMLPKIFDAFEQGDPTITRQFGGLGLGLAISKALLDLHGGTIRATSDGPGRGATFVCTFTLVAPPPKIAPTETPAASTDGKPARLRVMLVEDHVDTATVLSKLLSIRGFDVAVAHDVAGGLALAGSRPFDLVISDLGLPDGTGFELMTVLLSRHKLRGIALSGYGMEDDLRKSRSCGFVDHVVKPVDAQQLVAVIRRVMATD